MDESIPVPASLQPPRAFDAACRRVVDYLARAIPMGTWAVTRVVDAEQVILVTADTALGVSPGAAFPWSESFCRHMIAGDVPRIVPDTSAVDALAAPIAWMSPNPKRCSGRPRAISPIR